MADVREQQLYTVLGPPEGFFTPLEGSSALLLLTVTLGAGLVLMGCGDDTTTTPAPAPPPPPAPAPAPDPEPMAPATPTGLHVDETTENSITWHWTAVEGAVGYVVQASMDEMFDDTDTVLFDGVPFTTEDHYTATDLEPETTVHLRVASAAGTADAPLVSEFSAAVAGMSAMPPPAPTPFMVTFSLPEDAKSMYPMIPDDMTDKEKAMAMVNSQMTVTVNMPAIVAPMFVDDANPIGLQPGDQWPFAYVEWKAMQSMVVDTGVQFTVTPVTIGANQTPTPIAGAATTVTCGPFACATGDMAPEIGIADSAACDMWDPTLELQVGLIDNNQESHTGRAYVAGGDNPATTDETETDFLAAVEVSVFDGVDLGWTYTSDQKFNAKHDLAVVDSTRKGIDKSSSGKPLPSGSIGAITLGRTDGATTAPVNQQTYYGISAEIEDPESASGTGITATLDPTDLGSCQPVSRFTTDVTDPASPTVTRQTTLHAYNDNTRSRVSRPDNCFRATVDAGLDRNYLDPYEVELTLAAAQLSWGKIAWDAFEDITCEPRTFEATAQVDVCSLLAEDVEMLPDPSAVPVVQLAPAAGNMATDNVAGPTLAGFNLMYKDASMNRHRFISMWYLDDTTKKADDDTIDLYAAIDNDGDADTANAAADTNTVTGTVIGDTANHVIGAKAGVWVPTLDKDFDPMYGDLGKVDVGGDDKADNFASDDDSNACTAADGGSAATGKDGADKNSTLCDAAVDISASVGFVDGLGYGCDPVEVEYTLTCTWSARGNVKNTVGGNQTAITYDATDPADVDTNIDKFVSCKVE
ncbi:MAG: fibronectin type III domain-containing protein [Rhodospirillales bacterium]|nr:fibronectin type III domain-containing protein [Rhodospirillales bacterium]